MWNFCAETFKCDLKKKYLAPLWHYFIFIKTLVTDLVPWLSLLRLISLSSMRYVRFEFLDFVSHHMHFIVVALLFHNMFISCLADFFQLVSKSLNIIFSLFSRSFEELYLPIGFVQPEMIICGSLQRYMKFQSSIN